jgi:hypothetical protein
MTLSVDGMGVGCARTVTQFAATLIRELAVSRRSKDIGTDAERAVVRFLQENGFPHAERRALRGTHDAGDITGTPGVAWEVKGGDKAKTASDGLIEQWIEETRNETENADADVGVLVVQRKGVGPANAGRWWAIIPDVELVDPHYSGDLPATVTIRLHLAEACRILNRWGYGNGS